MRPGTDAAALVRICAEIARGDREEPAAVAAALRDARVVLHLANIRYAPAVLAGVGAGVAAAAVAGGVGVPRRVNARVWQSERSRVVVVVVAVG